MRRVLKAGRKDGCEWGDLRFSDVRRVELPACDCDVVRAVSFECNYFVFNVGLNEYIYRLAVNYNGTFEDDFCNFCVDIIYIL